MMKFMDEKLKTNDELTATKLLNLRWLELCVSLDTIKSQEAGLGM